MLMPTQGFDSAITVLTSTMTVNEVKFVCFPSTRRWEEVTVIYKKNTLNRRKFAKVIYL